MNKQLMCLAVSGLMFSFNVYADEIIVIDPDNVSPYYVPDYYASPVVYYPANFTPYYDPYYPNYYSYYPGYSSVFPGFVAGLALGAAIGGWGGGWGNSWNGGWNNWHNWNGNWNNNWNRSNWNNANWNNNNWHNNWNNTAAAKSNFNANHPDATKSNVENRAEDRRTTAPAAHQAEERHVSPTHVEHRDAPQHLQRQEFHPDREMERRGGGRRGGRR